MVLKSSERFHAEKKTAATTLLVFAALLDTCAAIGSVQSAAAKGKLLCKGKPYFNAKIKLFDTDLIVKRKDSATKCVFNLNKVMSEFLADFDDLMGETRSDRNGSFYVSGNETELTTIDPKINIYHNCEDEHRECLRKIQIILPKDFVAEGFVPHKTFDAGVLNLSAKFPGESRDCIN